MAIVGYKWSVSSSTQKELEEIEILKKVFEKLPLSESLIKIIRRKYILNSAVSSAQIENIPSTVQNPRKEGKNLEQAYHLIYSSHKLENVSVQAIRDLHKQAMRDLSGSAGEFRMEPWGVFNQAGQQIHHAPLHTLVPGLISDLCEYLSKLDDHPVVISAIAQFIFEKIHPFADGNGRTGRLLSAYLLHKVGYGFRGLVPLESYINQHRSWYYQALEPSHNCTEFIDFFLEGMVFQANQSLEEMKDPIVDTPRNKLMPRRREILEIVTDHPECSFDFLQRRFIGVNSRALHRDIKYLQDHDLVEKLGLTRGAVYVAKS